MAYEDLKSTANQISNQSSANLGIFTSQASPLQTDIIGKMLPLGGPSWKGISPIKTPTEIQQNQENMGNAYKDMQSSGLNSKTIGRNLANGMYEGGSNWLSKPSTETEASLSGLTQPSGIIKPEMGPETKRELRKQIRQENRQERQEARKEWQGSAEGQAAMNNVPSGTGNTFVDSFNAFSAMKDAPKFKDTDGGAKAFMSSKTGLGISGAANAAAGVVGGLADAGVSFDVGLGNYNDRPAAQQLNETQEVVRQGIYSGVSAIPMFGPLISAGLQLTDGLGKMLGTQMSNISKDAAEDAGLSRGFNNVVATIPGLGSVLGAFTKKADEFEIDRERLAGVGSAYDMSTFDSAEDLSGGLFLGQRNKVNDFIAEQNRLRDTMTSISDTQKLRKEGASAAAADLAQQNKNRYSGLTGGQMAIGKKGMKLDLSWARDLLSKFQKGGKIKSKTRTLEELKVYADSVNPRFVQRMNDPNITGINFIDDKGNAAFGTHYMTYGYDDDGNYYVYPRIQEINGMLQFLDDDTAWHTAVKNKNILKMNNEEEAINFAENYKKVYPIFQKFQKGGKLGTPGIESNVIVEGAYHAHKNHLDEVNPELSDMTPKGIPVATEDASGNKTQVAEIEVGELILTKDLTDKLEELYKDGSDDAAIQAGMLFASEIIDNTVDNKGGVLDEND